MKKSKSKAKHLLSICDDTWSKLAAQIRFLLKAYAKDAGNSGSNLTHGCCRSYCYSLRVTYQFPTRVAGDHDDEA